jgi:hypothetical protein
LNLLKAYRSTSEIDYVMKTPLNLSDKGKGGGSNGKLSVPTRSVDDANDGGGFADLDTIVENHPTTAAGGGEDGGKSRGLWRTLTGSKDKYRAMNSL